MAWIGQAMHQLTGRSWRIAVQGPGDVREALHRRDHCNIIVDSRQYTVRWRTYSARAALPVAFRLVAEEYAESASQDEDEVFVPIRPGSLVTEAHDQIRAAILSGRLKAGERVRDSVVAARMGLSRAPVREALRLVEQTGLLTKSPNRSYTVAQIGRDDLAELAGMRIALETLAVRVVVRQQRVLDDAREALGGLRHAVDSGDEAALIAADRGFHESLVGATGQRRLMRAYAEIRDQVELALRSTGGPQLGRANLVERHENLLHLLEAALRTGESTAVVARLEHHILEGMGWPAIL
jgi:DNA-binding GntR family transcriptional regulator